MTGKLLSIALALAAVAVTPVAAQTPPAAPQFAHCYAGIVKGPVFPNDSDTGEAMLDMAGHWIVPDRGALASWSFGDAKTQCFAKALLALPAYIGPEAKCPTIGIPATGWAIVHADPIWQKCGAVLPGKTP